MPHKKRPKWEQDLEVALAKGVASLFRALPWRWAQQVGGTLAVLFHDLVGVRKKKAREQLQQAFPDRPARWAAVTTREVYRHFGMVAVELARIPSMTRSTWERWADVKGYEHLEKWREHGRGGIVVSGHLGNWELIGAHAAHYMGFPATYIVAGQANKGIEELLDEHRRAAGIEIVKKANAMRETGRALKKNRIVAMLIDQDARRAGVFVPFFGRPASTPRGVAVYARKYRPVVVFFDSYRDSHGKIHGRFQPVEFEFSDDKERDIREYTALLTSMLERAVRRTPEQWLWLHRRWKTQPKSM